MNLCHHDVDNYDHMCNETGIPCKYLDHYEDCPILKNEKGLEESRVLGRKAAPEAAPEAAE